MVKQLSKSDKLKTLYWSLVATTMTALVSVQPVMADTIWNRFSTIMKDIYGQVVAISTVVAVTVAAIALVVRMVSRNQRAVDEATAWLKRIVIWEAQKQRVTCSNLGAGWLARSFYCSFLMCGFLGHSIHLSGNMSVTEEH